MRAETKRDIALTLADLLNQILRSPLEVVGTEELARRCGYSRSHLTRVFHEVSGESLGLLHRRIRMERAAYGLKHGFTVREAALLGGFESPEAFCRAFRRAYDMPPRDFKKAGLDWQLFSPDGLHWNEHWDGVVDAKKLRIKYETSVERSAPFRVATIHHVGNYGALVEGWQTVPYVENRRWITVYRDNMWTCPNKDLMRSDLGFILDGEETPPAPFQIITIPGMTTVKTKRFIRRTERNEAWSYLCGLWPHSQLSWDEYESWPLPFEQVRTRACLGFS